jgi:hypothetical protein
MARNKEKSVAKEVEQIGVIFHRRCKSRRYRKVNSLAAEAASLYVKNSAKLERAAPKFARAALSSRGRPFYISFSVAKRKRGKEVAEHC